MRASEASDGGMSTAKGARRRTTKAHPEYMPPMPDQSCPPTSAEADCAMDVTNDVPMAPASTESPPVPAAGAEKDENEPMSDVETKLAMLERRVQQLEEQVRAGVRSSPAPPTPLKREAAFTPDVFNPFWDEIVEGPSVPGTLRDSYRCPCVPRGRAAQQEADPSNRRRRPLV